MNALKTAMAQLYQAFSNYDRPPSQTLSLFDFGPTEAEALEVAKPLPDISFDVIRSMEFFAPRWDSWGSKAEVSYFLPRLLEYLASDITVLDYPSTFGLFKYKLKGALTLQNKDWNAAEKSVLRHFFLSLFQQELQDFACDIKLEPPFARFDILKDPLPFMKYLSVCLYLGIPDEDIIQAWQGTPHFHLACIASLFDVFQIEWEQGLLEYQWAYWHADKAQITETEFLVQLKGMQLNQLDLIPAERWQGFIWKLYQSSVPT